MTQDPIFNLFHRYNKLVRRQLVKPLAHDCGTPFITGLDDTDGLVLVCVACDVNIEPGANTIANVRAVVKEHFEDE